MFESLQVGKEYKSVYKIQTFRCEKCGKHKPCTELNCEMDYKYKKLKQFCNQCYVK